MEDNSVRQFDGGTVASDESGRSTDHRELVGRHRPLSLHKPPRGGATRGSWLAAAAIVAGCLGYWGWQAARPAELPHGFASSNGRIEAVEIDVATKLAGRLVSLEVNEGDFVTAGQVLAQMDTEVLQAQLLQAQADLRRSVTAVDTARSIVRQRQSELAAAQSVVAQRQAELELANRNFTRADRLMETNAISREEFDTIRATLASREAAVSSAEAHVAGAEAAISTAQSQIIEAEAAVLAAEATIDRIQADIDESTLRSPRDGRVQFRIAQAGEVLPAGGKVLNMVDLADVYMTLFLPTAAAGRVPIGAEARLVLDAAPHVVIPAKVTFVADVAQFTPKTVETAEERQKLTFRLKAHIAPELLKAHIRSVKTGLPGMAYVQWDPTAAWPEFLNQGLVQQVAVDSATMPKASAPPEDMAPPEGSAAPGQSMRQGSQPPAGTAPLPAEQHEPDERQQPVEPQSSQRRAESEEATV